MKKISMLILAVLLAISLTGCIPDSLGDYRRAAVKTDQIKKGRTTIEFSTTMNFNTDGMTAEQIKQINNFKNMKGSSDVLFDDEAGKGIFRNYLNLGGLGFDFDMYINGEEVFMKLPVVGKYIKLEGFQDSELIQQEEKFEPISDGTLTAISEKWLGMLDKEEVFQGRNIVLTTPDGEVKTTEYTIRLKDEQIKSMAAYMLDMLSTDEKLKETYEKYINKNVEQLEDSPVEKLLAEMKKILEVCRVESFNYTAYVDIDGYIVNEILQISIKVDNGSPATVVGIDYRLEIKNWDINRDQSFEFPVLTEDNTLEMERMGENMPSILEDIIKKRD